jgi:hypothetical protein
LDGPTGFPQPEEASMAHAKDKGASKNVKKKAKKGTVTRGVGE